MRTQGRLASRTVKWATAPFVVALLLILAFVPRIAFAQCADPEASTIPARIQVVTPRGSGVDSTAAYTVILRDYFGSPIVNSTVTLDFSGCATWDQVKLAKEQPFLDPPGQASCPPPGPYLSATTNYLGEARFILLGSVLRRDLPHPHTGCVRVYGGCGQLPASVSMGAAYDQDGVNGLTANDLFQIGCDAADGQPHVRSDFNGDGWTNSGDVAMWANQYFQAHEPTRTPERCDGLPTMFAPTILNSSPLRLAWNYCAAGGGLQTRTSACNTNFGAYKFLEASFVAPSGVDRMTGFEAELWVVGNQGTLIPEWWRFEPGGCRMGRGFAGSPITDPEMLCNPLEWYAPLFMSSGMDYLAGGNVGRIRVVGALGDPGGGTPQGLALQAGQEYSLFSLRVSSALTVGDGSCAGCSEPIAVIFRSLKLTQPPTAAAACQAVGPASAGDIVLVRDLSTSEAVAFWQAPPAGWETVAVPKAEVPSLVRLSSTNPISEMTRVELGLPRPMRCRLSLYDIVGRRRSVLLDEIVPAGTRVLTWDGRDNDGRPLASGCYILRLVTEEGTLSRQLIRLR